MDVYVLTERTHALIWPTR